MLKTCEGTTLQRLGEGLSVGSGQLTVEASVGPTNGRERGSASDDELVEVALVVGSLGLG